MKIETLKANELFKDLGDNVLNEFLKLNKNAEKIAVEEAIVDASKALDNAVRGLGIDGISSQNDLVKIKTMLADSTTNSANKIKELEADLAKAREGKGNEDEVTKLQNELKDLKSIHTKASKDYEDNLKKAVSEVTQRYEGDLLESRMSAFQFRDDVDEKLISLAKKAAKIEYAESYIKEERNGKTVFIDKATQKPMYNETTLEPLTEADILKPFLASVLKVDKQGAGSGTQGSGTGGGNLITKTARTKNEAFDLADKEAKEKGISNGTAEYNEAIAKVINSTEYAALPD